MKIYTPNGSDSLSRINLVAENHLESDFIDYLKKVLVEGNGSIILYDGHSRQIASFEHGFGVSLP